nr:RNA-directed DNA polymerase, eukaryota [Tanacetum cinerariifolium]
MGPHFQNSLQSNFDQTVKISKSMFISNFLDDCSNRDLWKMSTPSGIASGLKQPTTQHKSGFNGTNFTDILKPALVLDDSCLMNRDLAKCVMGEVMIELNSFKSKSKFMEHVRVALWFRSLCNVQPNFAAKERIVWVVIEGVPLNAWSRSTFQKIGSKWGELVDLEDGYEDLFARKRKVFWARAKELFVWSPSFKEVPEREIFSDDEPIKANDDANNLNLGDAENNSEVASDTYFGDNGEDQGVDQHQAEPSKVQEYSVPPGFTPINDIPTGIQDNPIVSSAQSPSKSARINSSPCQSNGLSLRVMEDTVPADVYTSPFGSKSKHGSYKGGSMLEVLDSMIKVGQAMGFFMDGCLKDMEIMIGSQGAREGGILCLWDPLMFRKDHHIISDNFVVLYGTWVPNNAKLLIVSVYAPQSAADKHLLWSYIMGLLSRWKGEVLVTGDFNEVYFESERSTWNSFVLEDSNGMSGRLIDIQDKLSNIDHTLDQGGASDEILLSRMELMKKMHDIKSTVAREQIQKAKIQWAVEGDENSKFFHGVANRKRVQLSVKGVMIDGEWVDEPDRMASVLVNGSPTSEFQFHCGLKQGDPLASYLFILVMESLHLSISRAVEAGIFFGIKIDPTISISHLFYADDAIFIGQWSDSNLRSIIHMLHYFSLASGLKINLQKSNLLGVGVNDSLVNEAAGSIGCSVMKAPFKYLGVMVGSSMSKISAWDEMVGKIKSRLSKWKVNTLSIGGRLMLLKAVLGYTPIYPMSLYKVLKSVLHEMESSRRSFLMVLKVSIGRFRGLSGRKCSLLRNLEPRSSSHCSNWLSILWEVSALKLQGIDFLSHCKRRVGSGMQTRFWEDLWLGETPFRELFLRLYALKNNKDCFVVVKMQGEIDMSFRRQVRGGVESQQLEIIKDLVRLKVLSNVDDRWAWDLNGDGDFCVKDARDLVDEVLLPKENVATRCIKTIPIKVNVFAWKLRLDRLPTRSNRFKRGVQ